MIVVLFEFEPDPALEDRYFELAGLLRENVEPVSYTHLTLPTIYSV